jgi:type I restriction enzyme S subunit
MTGWSELLIKDIAQRITSGGTPSSLNAAYYNGDIPWLKTQEINFNRIWDTETKITKKGLQESSAKIIEENSVIVAMYGATAGRIGINKIKLCTNQACCNITPDNGKCDYRFLYYYLYSNNAELINLSSGAAQQNLNTGIIGNFPLRLPSLRIQQGIANILSGLDEKIDLLNSQNSTLLKLTKSIFKKHLQNGNNESKSISTLVHCTIGGEWGKEVAQGDYNIQVCCIRGTDIADLQTGLANRAPVRFVKEKKFESIAPKDGDILLEISGGTDDQSTGRVVYINEFNRKLFSHPIIFSNFCRLIRPGRKEFSYFLYLYLVNLYDNNEFFNLENGSSGIKNLDYKHLLYNLGYLLPENENDIVLFDKTIKPFFEKIDKNKHQIKTLSGLRDFLMPRLVSGDMKIK